MEALIVIGAVILVAILSTLGKGPVIRDPTELERRLTGRR